MKRGFYAGSFDPFTKGHLAIVMEALTLFDEVVVGIGINDAKKCMFTANQRTELVKSSIDDLLNVYSYHELNGIEFTINEVSAIKKILKNRECIKAIEYDDLTIDAALRFNCCSLIRGERIGDSDEEMKIAIINKELLEIRGENLLTTVIKGPELKYTYVSSSMVKNLCSMGEYILAKNYVYPSVHQRMMQVYLPKAIDYLKINSMLGVIVSNYNRFEYHNLSHISYCLNFLKIYYSKQKKTEQVIQSIEKLVLAIIMHDVVYDDIKASCDFLRKFVKSSKPETLFNIDEISKIIWATDYENSSNEVPTNDENQKLMSDVDLAILADINYGIYAMQVRQEWSKYNDSEYAEGRLKVLEFFSNKERIYQTDFFFEKFEQKAKANIKKEIAYWQTILS